ncbi:ABC transporter ATP-binding protein [Paenibacillus tuaregi]|uniref:ABC transporter ATP-binding protein n=1 Tax=Paenibacillus tuaregi TaxID=1816681 RepID=UPI0008393818|nr:ABC transporter ATP-binding protein [Paenibacillus tuaregi]
MSIIVQHLTKSYRTKINVLHNMDLVIPQGMFGLLGRNGAGKTTFMRILSTLLAPTSGSVEICNITLNKKNIPKIKALIGYLPQEFNFYPNLRIDEALDYMGILYLMDDKRRARRIDEVLMEVNLFNERTKKVKQLSGGMRRRLGIAQAILHEPQVLIVDEPTAGVDPLERISIRNLLSDYSKNHTVLLSSHIVEDIAVTCQQVAVLNRSEVAYSGELKELIKRGKGAVWSCSLQNVKELDEMKRKYTVISSQYFENSIEVRILSRIRPNTSSIEVEPSIEDAYMLLLEEGSDRQ